MRAATSHAVCGEPEIVSSSCSSTRAATAPDSTAGGSVREVNQAALELLKGARDDIVGRPLAEYIAEEDRVAFLARTVGPMIGAAKPHAWMAHLQPGTGDRFSAEFSVRTIPLKKSGVGGLCWLIRPVA